jgi:type I thyroxine 5'-deiodinase
VVYIQEAHASDMWQDEQNIREGILIRNPFTARERQQTARSCVRNLGIEIPALVDGIGNPVEAAYTAWPDRLYVIDRQGRIAYKSAAGPYGFRPADAEAALRRLEL